MPVPTHPALPQLDTPGHPHLKSVPGSMPTVMERGGAWATVSLAGLVGATPVLWIEDPLTDSGRGFWAKLEGHNPGGIKDRAGLHLVARARQRGLLAPGAPIVESTSGTLGLGLALAGRVYGHPVTLVTDDGLEPLLRHLLAAYGTHLEVVTDPHPTGGWQAARLNRIAALLAAQPGAWWPDQYSNPDNAAAYGGLAAELITQLGRVDVLVCSVGTGGHSGGIARVLRACNPDLRVVGVDAVGSTIFGQPAQPRLMRGLGSSIYPRNVAYGLFDEVHWVGAAEAVWTCRQLAAHRYATGGWSVGAVALVAAWLARTLPGGSCVATVFPDGPHRYWDTIYSDAYCRTHGLLDRPPASDPDHLTDPRERVVTRWSRCTTVVDPLADTRTEPGAGSRQAPAPIQVPAPVPVGQRRPAEV